MNLVRRFALAAGALLVASCSFDTTAPGILDAAQLHAANSEVLQQSIDALKRSAPASAIKRNLSRHFSIEQVGFVPADGRSPGIAWLALHRDREREVGLIFMTTYDPDQLAVFTGRTFETCGADAEKAAENPPRNVTSIYCRIDENWLAFELIEERSD